MTAELLDETAALARGKYVSENVRNFMLDGEVVGNYDMILADRWEKHVLRQKAERDGCCNELGPMSNGRCRKFCYVMCPLWEAFVVTCCDEPFA